ncbi:hypothetical protein CI109_102048 [Kwoniella shandongensis]|uniref:Uncharacterized protein n=1 Tax=Kwoniella shandongensis TaxID=1734106 RepID=A0A5M6BQC8_9TREE|nr:uncharacterized protein CI109_007373 [Kwoniella shandongensis]KAA5524281.1 hypothetical protein CI109_007373 [Kwoniella shandongensis]
MAYLELPRPVHTALDILLPPIIRVFVLPPTTIYHTLRYLLYEPPFPGCTFRHYIAINRRRVFYGWLGWARLPAGDVEYDIIPPSSEKYLKTCRVTRVECSPYEEDEYSPWVLRQGREEVTTRAVPGFWIERIGETDEDLDRPARPEERLVFFIIGGGYVGGHPLRIHTAWSIAELTDVRVFCVNYRKSLSADSAFPASLLDCLAGLQYVVQERGFEAKNIMLCGDSAGANASLALARCLGEMESAGGRRFGQVGSMCLHSPWSDMTSSFPSVRANRYTDHLVDLTTVNIPSHTRHFPNNKSNLYFSPALTTSGGFGYLVSHQTKVYISAGTAEAFYDEILALHHAMKRDGVDVQLRTLDGATHSDFVWLDRNEIDSMGWTWTILRKDFEDFWKRVTRGM